MAGPRIRFVGTSYTLQHRKADVQRSINLMPVTNETPGGKSVAYLDQVPGLTEFSLSFEENTGWLKLETGDYLLQENGARIRLDDVFVFLMQEDGNRLFAEDRSRIRQE